MLQVMNVQRREKGILKHKELFQMRLDSWRHKANLRLDIWRHASAHQAA